MGTHTHTFVSSTAVAGTGVAFSESEGVFQHRRRWQASWIQFGVTATRARLSRCLICQSDDMNFGVRRSRDEPASTDSIGPGTTPTTRTTRTRIRATRSGGRVRGNEEQSLATARHRWRQFDPVDSGLGDARVDRAERLVFVGAVVSQVIHLWWGAFVRGWVYMCASWVGDCIN